MLVIVSKTSTTILAMLALILLVLTAGTSYALLISGDGERDSFEGEFNINPSSVTIKLKNTSTYPDSKITAFAFNIPDEADINIDSDYVSFTANGNDAFKVFKGEDVNFNGNFSFLLGASSTNKNKQVWTGGGNPNDGLEYGDEATFRFGFEDDFLSGIDSDQFTQQDYWLGVRFRGGDESDVLHATSTPQVTQTPEPATMLLFGTGLIGLAWIGRRQLQRRKDA